MTSASACGKIILLGEHAVVYGRPALAVPLPQLRASVEITPIDGEEAGSLRILATDIDLTSWLHALDANHPLAKIIHLVRQAVGIEDHPALELRISSNIPVASGLGSGTAVSVAIVRALSARLGNPLPAEMQSALTFEVEKLYHGTPSGIDNTVVAHEMPVFFLRDQVPEPFGIGAPLTLVIGDTGLQSNTSIAVGMVREAWQADADRYESLFDQIGEFVERGRAAIEAGNLVELGSQMNQNQVLLRDIGVSSPELETLIEAALSAGALGAKLSGGGMGGNMIALVETNRAHEIENGLLKAGATRTLVAEVGA
jgi:mevalonate kinase